MSSGDPDRAALPDQTAEPQLVCFFISFPWPIAIPDEHRFTANREEVVAWLTPPAARFNFLPHNVIDWLIASGQRNFVSIVLRRWPQTLAYPLAQDQAAWDLARSFVEEREDPVPEGISFGKVPPPSDTRAFGTVVQALTPLIVGPGEEGHWAASQAFDRCLEELSAVLKAYMLTSNDLRPRPITRQSVLPVIPIVMVDAFTGSGTILGSFRANWGEAVFPIPPNELTGPEFAGMMRRWSLIKRGHPLITFVERTRVAQQALRIHGDGATAVIACHTAGEVFFDTLLLMLAWEELNHLPGSTVTREDVVGWFTRRASVESRLRQHYHVRLEGGWDPAREGTPLHRWVTNVARLRNRTVHAGYTPTEREASTALETLNDVEQYAKDLLLEDRNRGRYPRTSAMTVGVDGLQRRGLYRGKIKRLIESSDEEDWLGSFTAFRSWLDTELSSARADGT